jgi:hypothetical protein
MPTRTWSSRHPAMPGGTANDFTKLSHTGPLASTFNPLGTFWKGRGRVSGVWGRLGQNPRNHRARKSFTNCDTPGGPPVALT